jgi:hypothetical protein
MKNGNLKNWIFTLILGVVFYLFLPYFTSRIIALIILEAVFMMFWPCKKLAFLVAVIILMSLFEIDDYLPKPFLEKWSEKNDVKVRLEKNIKIIDWIILGLCIAGVIISVHCGRISSWLDYISIVLSNDYSDALSATGLRSDYYMVFSFCVSMFISAIFANLVRTLLSKFSNSIITRISAVMIDSLINVWIINIVIAYFVIVHTGGFWYMVLGTFNSEWLDRIDIPIDGLPNWLQVVIVLILCVLFLGLIALAFTVKAFSSIAIGSSMMKGAIFLAVVFFIDYLFPFNYAESNAVLSFIILFLLNFIASTFAEAMEAFHVARYKEKG